EVVDDDSASAAVPGGRVAADRVAGQRGDPSVDGHTAAADDARRRAAGHDVPGQVRDPALDEHPATAVRGAVRDVQALEGDAPVVDHEHAAGGPAVDGHRARTGHDRQRAER